MNWRFAINIPEVNGPGNDTQPGAVVDLSGRIGTELRGQYVLGYKPSDAHHDGRWRKIMVSVTPPFDRPALAAHARTGYYSPRD